jgi:very-short-patch-repair endonuclease
MGDVRRMEELEVVARQLRRHATRRSGGVPTVSLLVGEVGPLAARLEHLLRPTRLAVLTQPGTTPSALAEAWLKTAAGAQDLVSRALCAVMPERHGGEAGARAEWRARSPGERSRWLELAIDDSGESCSAHAARWLLDDCHDDAYRPRGDAVEAARRLGRWLPGQDWPALCLTGEQVSDLEQLVALAVALPAITLLAVVPTGAFARVDALLERRARTLLLEGLITASARPLAAPQLLSRAGSDEGVALVGSAAPGPLHQLRAEAASALHEARRARASAEAGAETAQERARSLAERLLYELLQRDPATCDLFELNRSMPFEFGPRPAEVDLVSTALKLAIEVDGYHHFTEAAAYRRDRRKDVLLQSHGFWVTRYLASDVVEQAEEVVGSVKALVCKRGGRAAERGED